MKRFKGIAGYLFPSPMNHIDEQGNKIIKPFDFRKPWARATETAGLSGIGFHTCRHTFCSNLAMAGASLVEIADAAGHKSLTSTMRYSHLCVEHKTKLIMKVFG